MADASPGLSDGVASAGVVDGSFLARRADALAADRSPDAMDKGTVDDGLAHLERIEAAIAAVASEVPDGELMERTFAESKAEIGQWIESLTAERSSGAGHGADAAEDEPLDLRTADLPGFGPGVDVAKSAGPTRRPRRRAVGRPEQADREPPGPGAA